MIIVKLKKNIKIKSSYKNLTLELDNPRNIGPKGGYVKNRDKNHGILTLDLKYFYHVKNKTKNFKIIPILSISFLTDKKSLFYSNFFYN